MSTSVYHVLPGPSTNGLTNKRIGFDTAQTPTQPTSQGAAEAGMVLAPWVVAPGDEERLDHWLRCRDQWLDNLEARSKAKNSRRAYAADTAEFFAAFAEGLMPWQVGRQHAMRWVEGLRARGLADATINRKVAACSSFYRWAMDEYVIMTSTGPRALWEHPNPFGSKRLRTKVQPYGKARFPSSMQIMRIIEQIDTGTLIGKRDLALVFGMVLTTRRVNEWVRLRWGDIHEGENGRWFEYRYKGGDRRKQAMPAAVWAVIEAYLRADGRWSGMAEDDYVFRATSDIGRIGPHVGPDYDPAGQPLGARRVNDLLKKYGKAAGVPDVMLHAHALRHAGARARKQAGADVYELKDVLGHASIAITQIYSDTALDEPVDHRAEDVVAAILPQQLRLRFK